MISFAYLSLTTKSSQYISQFQKSSFKILTMICLGFSLTACGAAEPGSDFQDGVSVNQEEQENISGGERGGGTTQDHPICGDGIVQADEECDDGNLDDTDSCLITCQQASCGDGFVQEGVEECDDGNLDNYDTCMNTCIAIPQVVQVEAGGFHTCVLFDNADVKCWGRADYGQLGYGNEEIIGDNETPVSVGAVELGGVATQLSLGGLHTCAIIDRPTVEGVAKCWGLGFLGRLGYGNEEDIGDDETPADVPLFHSLGGGEIIQIEAGTLHTCALIQTHSDPGRIKCWGLGNL